MQVCLHRWLLNIVFEDCAEAGDWVGRSIGLPEEKLKIARFVVHYGYCTLNMITKYRDIKNIYLARDKACFEQKYPSDLIWDSVRPSTPNVVDNNALLIY